MSIFASLLQMIICFGSSCRWTTAVKLRTSTLEVTNLCSSQDLKDALPPVDVPVDSSFFCPRLSERIQQKKKEHPERRQWIRKQVTLLIFNF
ncbi:UNVERIFIED_CONTAM: hypothetical protein H355_013306 [Colinus virginianus]|nr:hypothetical protein H355_013306 [Colinus virginianus]